MAENVLQVAAPLSPAEQPRTSTAGEERRAAARRKVDYPAVVQLWHDGKMPGDVLLVRISDISPQGIGIECGRRLLNGEQFVLRLTAGKLTGLLLYGVIHCTPTEDGFRAGATLIRALRTK